MFSVSVSAVDESDAVEKIARRIPAGFAIVGEGREESRRHLLFSANVEQVDPTADVNDCWVVLTSYGLSPSPGLGSTWEASLGASAR